MFRLLASLEWKSFLRSKAFAVNLFLKIVMGLGALYFIVCFAILGAGAYFILEDSGFDPLPTVNKFLIYFFFCDLTIRYLMQKMPVLNIKPLMAMPISKRNIIFYALSKCFFSFFNIYQAFFFIPFSFVLIFKGGLPFLDVTLWHISMLALILSNNLINVLINNKDSVFYPLLVVVAGLGIAQYYGWIDITFYTAVFFNGLSGTYYMFLLPLALLAFLGYMTYEYFRKHLYLDTGLKGKSEVATTENLSWLDSFGSMATFLKNDIRLLRRNKRSKMTLFTSVMFLFYGLLFFTGALEMYSAPGWQVFAAIFVSGGFLLTFGQFVPSWDSAYYPLMMSQNIPYKQYIASKWWLLVIGTAVSTVLAAFYLYFGLKIYLLIVCGAIYNIGVNSYLVLWAGAYVKTPIDLSSSKRAFGDKQAFNVKTLLLSLPKLLVPVILYAVGNLIYGPELGLGLLTVAGIFGFLFRNRVFNIIEKVYKTEKYKTLEAYKEKP